VPQGKIKKLVADKGFGFINTGGKKDLFFHHSAVTKGKFDDLMEGDEVEFEQEQSDKGPRARTVQKV